ncbi:MAG: hypothetical protein E7643_07385 [Ruminococcaceae bacterium]|nr:hypothetical protein [Oscillospiraceae bacterium]
MKLFHKLFRKKAKKLSIESDKPRNEYYENISVRFGIAQVVLYLLLFSFVILSFFANTELITYRNFYYFFKDLGATADAVDIFESDSLTYPTDVKQSFALYRKGLAVAGNSSVTVFSATGRQILSVPISYRNPTVVSAGKYFLVYESGGTRYSLYNSDVQIHSDTMEYPITGATISDSGKYALISSSKDHNSVVYLYNARFNCTALYNFKEYVMDVSLNSKGSHIGIVYTTATEGSFTTGVRLAEVGKDTAIASPKVSSSLGLSCAFTNGGKLAVVCSDRVTYYNLDGRVEGDAYLFDGLTLTNVDVGAEGIAISLKKNAVSEENRVIVFDKNGKIVYNETVVEKLGQLKRSADAVFWTTPSGVSRLNLNTKSIEKRDCLTDGRVLLAISETEVLCCSPQKAVYIGFYS